MSTPSTTSLNLRSLLEKEKLNGTNFLDWHRNLRIVLRMEELDYVLETPLVVPVLQDKKNREKHLKHVKDDNTVSCVMLASMSPELKKQFETAKAYDIIEGLKKMFQKLARIERFETNDAIVTTKLARDKPVGPHVLKMISLFDNMRRLGFPYSQELAMDIILSSLHDGFKPFRMNFNMQGMEKDLHELHRMLEQAEKEITPTPKGKTDILTVQKGKGFKKSGKGDKTQAKSKAKSKVVAPPPKPKVGPTPNTECHHCGGTGHWKRNCPKYLKDVKNGAGSSNTHEGIYVIDINLTDSTSWVFDTGCGSHICSNVQGLKASRRLSKGEVDLRVGNKAKVAALAVGTYCLSLPNG